MWNSRLPWVNITHKKRHSDIESLLGQHSFLQTERAAISLLGMILAGFYMLLSQQWKQCGWSLGKKIAFSPPFIAEKRCNCDSGSDRLLRLVVNQSITSKAISSQTAAELQRKSEWRESFVTLWGVMKLNYCLHMLADLQIKDNMFMGSIINITVAAG